MRGDGLRYIAKMGIKKLAALLGQRASFLPQTVLVAFLSFRICVPKTPVESHSTGVFLAEREGFEPSVGLWPTHDFQSCALDQLSHLSIV